MADANFADVSLLLHGNGTDASTTFTDSSSNTHTVTAAGNAQLDTAQKKWGTASLLFDGTGDYATVPDDATLNLTTGDFTIECWVRMNSIGATDTLLSKATGSGNAQYRLYFDAGNNWFGFEATNAANTDQLFIVYEDVVSTGVWYHVAVVRNGNVFTIYQDGVAGDSTTWANTLLTSTATLAIGGNNDGSASLNGWLDDVRITKGVARYTSGFTPPTAEFEEGPAVDVEGYISTAAIFGSPAILAEATVLEESYFANVSLLLHCNGSDASTTFTDSSSIGHTVTAVGNAQIDTAQSKWGGASGLLDGTGDYLTVPDDTSLVLSTGDFTVECWVHVNGATPDQIIMIRAVGPGGVRPWRLWYDSSPQRFIFDGQDTDGFTVYQIFSGAVTTGVWYHLAGTRSGNTIRFYVDGTMVGSATLTASLAVPISTVLSIGANSEGSNPFNGWIDDVRITKGVARYTDDIYIPPPEAEFPDGNNFIGYITGPGILGGVDGAQLFGGPTDTGYITTAAILGGAEGAKLFGGLAIGSITTDTILGGSAGARVFGSLVLAQISNGAILGGTSGAKVQAFHDFSTTVVGRPTTYVMDLVIDELNNTRVRVPISSWQGTQQTDNASYLGCVVPACEPWLDVLDVATEFIISRSVELDDGSVLEAEMARAPLETLQTDEGPTNFTASLSGYTDPYATDDDPNPSQDRTLENIRSVSAYSTGVRIRCGIDWFLRPAQRAFYAETSFIVSYINYYVAANTASVDEYMDVGERIEV